MLGVCVHANFHQLNTSDVALFAPGEYVSVQCDQCQAGKGLDWSDFDFCGDANEWYHPQLRLKAYFSEL